MSPLYLHASDLFSKFGFGDGDVLDDWYWDETGGPLPAGIDDHVVLRQLVRNVLLPAIRAAGHTVDVYDIETIHNPIRAERVDGVEFDVYDDETPEWALGISVAVMLADVTAVLPG